MSWLAFMSINALFSVGTVIAMVAAEEVGQRIKNYLNGRTERRRLIENVGFQEQQWIADQQRHVLPQRSYR